SDLPKFFSMVDVFEKLKRPFHGAVEDLWR
ncbi:hypothetical protein A2U01_0090484, partial [Trifolium medium]|nr:hypothetical protein [Trifolium medium]